MKKEDLNKLKEKVEALSKEDKIKRDLYLKRLADGTYQGPPTGHASIDKKHLKNFTDEEIAFQIPKKTCYQTMHEANKNHPNDIVFEYFGKKYTYAQFFKMIEKTKVALASSGVKAGDIVTVCSITTPEVLALFYALNRLGAVPNYVDIRYTSQSIKENLIESKSNKLFTLDIALPKIDPIISGTPVEEVIAINPVASASQVVRVVVGLKKGKQKELKHKDKYTPWSTFIKRDNFNTIDFDYKEDYPAAIVHTGGTTGVPKGVVLTNEDFNSVAYQTTVARTNQRRGWKFLNIMPPFIAYGLGLGLYSPVVLGWRTVIIPSFDPKEFSKLLRKHKPNGVMGVPIYWENVMNDPAMKNADMSYLEDVLVGGDKVQLAYENRINDFLRKHKSKAKLSKGYSMTEASALATFSNKKTDKPESVGIPLVKTKVAAFHPGTQDELKAEEWGELCIQSENMMLEYFDNEEETKKVKQKHVDGYWIHSGDIGYVDSDGFVFVKERIKRMIVRSGFKVFPVEIERVVSSIPFVAQSAVIGIPDEKDATAPKLFVTLQNIDNVSPDKIRDMIYDAIRTSNIPPYFEPVDIEILDEMPLTDIGKINYVELEKMEKDKKVKKLN